MEMITMINKLKKMINFAFDTVQEHLADFLIDVFKGVTGDFIEQHEDTIKEVVEIVEVIADFVTTKEASGTLEITKDIVAKWGIDIEEKEISLILQGGRDKSKTKHELAFKNIKNKLGVPEKYDHAIDLGINSIVAMMHEQKK